MKSGKGEITVLSVPPAASRLPAAWQYDAITTPSRLMMQGFRQESVPFPTAALQVQWPEHQDFIDEYRLDMLMEPAHQAVHQHLLLHHRRTASGDPRGD
jgi:hypothetical protein